MRYREGMGRNPGEEYLESHTYAELPDGSLAPMCGYGWNRSDGEAFSILRMPWGSQGTCLLCQKNLKAGKPPMTDGWPHKTKWL